MAYEVLPFEVLNIQIQVLIIQRTTCLHLQRSMLSKPVSPVIGLFKLNTSPVSLLLNRLQIYEKTNLFDKKKGTHTYL